VPLPPVSERKPAQEQNIIVKLINVATRDMRLRSTSLREGRRRRSEDSYVSASPFGSTHWSDSVKDNTSGRRDACSSKERSKTGKTAGDDLGTHGHPPDHGEEGGCLETCVAGRLSSISSASSVQSLGIEGGMNTHLDSGTESETDPSTGQVIGGQNCAREAVVGGLASAQPIFSLHRRNERKKHAVRKSCEQCRHKRVKCDGLLPCSRCKHRELECFFLERKPRLRPGETQGKAFIPLVIKRAVPRAGQNDLAGMKTTVSGRERPSVLAQTGWANDGVCIERRKTLNSGGALAAAMARESVGAQKRQAPYAAVIAPSPMQDLGGSLALDEDSSLPVQHIFRLSEPQLAVDNGSTSLAKEEGRIACRELEEMRQRREQRALPVPPEPPEDEDENDRELAFLLEMEPSLLSPNVRPAAAPVLSFYGVASPKGEDEDHGFSTRPALLEPDRPAPAWPISLSLGVTDTKQERQLTEASLPLRDGMSMPRSDVIRTWRSGKAAIHPSPTTRQEGQLTEASLPLRDGTSVPRSDVIRAWLSGKAAIHPSPTTRQEGQLTEASLPLRDGTSVPRSDVIRTWRSGKAAIHPSPRTQWEARGQTEIVSRHRDANEESMEPSLRRYRGKHHSHLSLPAEALNVADREVAALTEMTPTLMWSVMDENPSILSGHMTGAPEKDSGGGRARPGPQSTINVKYSPPTFYFARPRVVDIRQKGLYDAESPV
jgi:hypothetical protein